MNDEVCVKRLGGGWLVTLGEYSLGIFEERQAMGIARRIHDGTITPEDIVRDDPVVWKKRRR